MRVYNTSEPQTKPPVIMLVYGEAGIGKTSFCATAPKPILADCEFGTKYFGLRGIKLDVAQIQQWGDMKEFSEFAKNDKYETLCIDPIGELMDKLKIFMVSLKDSKLVQKDGSPTMAGWGWIKKTMRSYIKFLRDSGKHVILVAHIEERKDGDRMIKRPKIETKLADDLIGIVDVCAYMTIIKDENGESKRVLIVNPEDDKYIAKDRTGQLARHIEPNFTTLINSIQWDKIKWETKLERPATPNEPTTEEKTEIERIQKEEELKNKMK